MPPRRLPMPGDPMGQPQPNASLDVAPMPAGTMSVREDLDLTLSSDPIAVRLTLRRLVGRLVSEGIAPDSAGKAEQGQQQPDLQD